MATGFGKRGWSLAAGPVVVALGMVSGCGGDVGPTTYPVSGQVVFPGGRPWTGGTITFRSTHDPGMIASGEIQADGHFTLTTYYIVNGRARTRPGAVAGEHTVTVEEPEQPVRRGAAGKNRTVILARKYPVEPRENSLVVETPAPGRR